jgi:DNA-binding transcriptional LysR family regulator
MHQVAAELATTTSSVSQAIAALAREAGTPLTEPDGRRVRLTPAGHRLAEHAVTILAAVDAARLDLDPAAEPVGAVRVAGFATAIRLSLLPAVTELARTHPGIELRIREHEPPEALDLLNRDEIDLALAYDYNLAPASWRSEHEVVPLWDVEWGLGVPSADRHLPFASYADHDWIVNSRHTADEDVLRTLASLNGFTPRVVHRVDALELVDDLIAARLGVALLPRGRTSRRGVSVRPLRDPRVFLRGFAVWRRGRDRWSPLRAVLHELTREPAGDEGQATATTPSSATDVSRSLRGITRTV